MPNAWVIHVKKWSAENNKTYGCAVSDPDCRASYKKPIKEKKLTKKQKLKNLENEAYEMKMMEQEEKKQRQKQKDEENEALMKYYEEERKKEKDNSLYLTDWLDIKIVNKESGKLPEEMKYFNKMFNLINNYFKTGDVLTKISKVDFTEKAQEYILNWLEKKNNYGSAELSDFIKLVVFPRLKKDNPKIDNITLILFAILISTDLKKMIDIKGYGQETQFNSYRITLAFLDHKVSNVWSELKNKIKGLKEAREEYLLYLQGGGTLRTRL
jgi:hypothetical protein